MPFFVIFGVDMKEYKTIEKFAVDKFTEKKSEFIGYAKPVETVEEAMNFVSEIKKKHWDATHNVWAYIMKDGITKRCSDDGEPSGTAGVPVLDVIEKSGVVGACVVVTRYFGGILLGAGGLVRAYSHGSKIALEASNIITMALCDVLDVCVDYPFYDRLNILLNDFNSTVKNTEFTDRVSVKFTLQSKDTADFNEKLFELSNGKYHSEITGNEYAKID